MKITVRAQVSSRWQFLAQPAGGYPLLSNNETDVRTWLTVRGVNPDPVLEQAKADGEVTILISNVD